MSNKRVLILGGTGQLSRALKVFAADGFHVHMLSRPIFDLSWNETDILPALKPFKSYDIIVNAAAYTAVDAAEDDQDMCFRVNATGPASVAKFCGLHGIAFIHLSTDYVFDGNADIAYSPNHKTKPLGVYGASKLSGETLIEQSGCYATILRTSWVYDGIGKNFLTTMLRIAQTQSSISVVSDQIGRPTYAGHLAQACWEVIKKIIQDTNYNGGTFHVTGSGRPISWADFAKEIFIQAMQYLPHEIQVSGIPSSEYPTRVTRPKYSVLDILSFENEFGIRLPVWQEGIVLAIEEWLEHNKGVING